MGSRRRGFGRVRRLPSGRYQAGYLGPDLSLHNALDTFHTREDAEAWLSRERELTHSENWRPPRVRAELARRKPATLETFAEAWLGSRTLKPRTHALYRSLLDRFILPGLGDLPLKDLSPALVRAWHASVSPNRPTQRAHAYSLLRSICATAVADDLVVANPCRVAGAGSATRARRIVPPTLTEIERLVRSMPEPYQLFVLLAAWCGLRLGELIELRRKDVDCEALVLHVTRAATRVGGGVVIGVPKSDAGVRSVHVPPHLGPVLLAHLRQHVQPGNEALLFPSVKDPGATLHHQTLYKQWGHARVAAGRPDLRIHDLRHGAAVMAAQSGATLAELMQRLGHSTSRAAMRYQHAALGRDAEIAVALSEMARRAEVSSGL